MRRYSVTNDFASDICKVLGLDPNRVRKLRFDFDAEKTDVVLAIEVEFLPEYLGGLKDSYPSEELPALDELEAGYHASET